MTRRALVWLLLVGCGAADNPIGPGTSAVAVDLSTATASGPGPTAAPTTVVECTPPAEVRCDGVVPKASLAEASAAIDAARARVVASTFTDVDALIELARLELLRDGSLANQEGPDDAARATKDAMRAVAVDGARAEARFVLVLALARSLEGLDGARGAQLDLVEIALSNVPRAAGPLGAAIATMRGLVALERGDRTGAARLFEEATSAEPSLAGAWIARGDLARAAGAFDEANAHYEKARALTPDDALLLASVDAASRGRRLALPESAGPTSSSSGPFVSGPLAPPAAATPARCSAGTATQPEQRPLCTALDALVDAKSAEAKSKAAGEILSAVRGLDGACAAKKPACGPHIDQAIVAASHAFLDANAFAKSVATLRLLVGREASGASSAEVAARATLELGDRYLALGVFDEAASWYERFAERAPKEGFDALHRALLLRIGLGQSDAARKNLDALLKHHGASPRVAEAILSFIAHVRGQDGDGAAAQEVASRGSVLERAGATQAAEELLRSPRQPRCGRLFGCNVRRLASTSVWSKGAR